MSTVTTVLGTRTQLSGAAAALASLANVTYVLIGTITIVASNKVPADLEIELSATPGTVSGTMPGIYLFAQLSMDGTNFGSGPTSGTTTTDEANLVPIGFLPLNTSAALKRGFFSLAAVCPNFTLPYAVKIIAKNSSGAALASGDVYTQLQTGDIT